MTDSAERLEEATAHLAAGREAVALELLRELLQSTEDTGVIGDIRILAAEAHEESRGFHKIEWQRLMIDAEARTTAPAAGRS